MSDHCLSQTYVAASHQLDNACTWLRDVGIDYSKTRIGRYRNLFSDLAKYQLANTLHKFFEKHTFDEWVNAAHETAELVRIYEGLSVEKKLVTVHETTMNNCMPAGTKDYRLLLRVTKEVFKKRPSTNEF